MDDEQIDAARLLQMEERAHEIARLIVTLLPKDCGFFLWLGAMGDAPESTYVSNCDRVSMIEALEELIMALRECTDTASIKRRFDA